jgi:hypothetical protein
MISTHDKLMLRCARPPPPLRSRTDRDRLDWWLRGFGLRKSHADHGGTDGGSAARRHGGSEIRRRLGGGSGITAPVVAQARRPLTDQSCRCAQKFASMDTMIPGQEVPSLVSPLDPAYNSSIVVGPKHGTSLLTLCMIGCRTFSSILTWLQLASSQSYNVTSTSFPPPRH